MSPFLWGHFQKGCIYLQNANSFSQLNKKSWKHLYVNFNGKCHDSLSKYTALHSACIYSSFIFLFNQMNIVWREKEEKGSIHGMILSTINLWCDVIIHFGTGSVLLEQYISVFKNKMCCTRQNSAWQCCRHNLSCTLVPICCWRTNKFFK